MLCVWVLFRETKDVLGGHLFPVVSYFFEELPRFEIRDVGEFLTILLDEAFLFAEVNEKSK